MKTMKALTVIIGVTETTEAIDEKIGVEEGKEEEENEHVFFLIIFKII